MSNNIEGKVVVITGASSGLGEATARLLGRQRRPPRAAEKGFLLNESLGVDRGLSGFSGENLAQGCSGTL